MARHRHVTTVPDVVGLAAVDACAAVIAADLVPAGPGESSPAPEFGTVVRQTPEPGASATPGAPVVLVSATGGHGATPAGPVPTDADAPTPA
jgi:beta-lactam-binding protein with PASTA domain